MSLPVRLAALLHDLGKPHVDIREHAAEGARIADRVLERLRYPTRLRHYVVDLIAAKQADLRAKNIDQEELARTLRLAELVEREASQPHRVSDLEVDGSDLLALGYREGPELGSVLSELLDEVVEDPGRNRKEWLLERAKERLA